jgi:alpha-amylase
MTKRIALALIVHNHQPVGNFGWVIEDVYDKAYEPLIGALERHPQIRLALHYTGPLLEWMAAERPDSIARLRALVERDQVEILGGGMYEPILVALPERDRAAQLERMRDEVERRFGPAPSGAWLAERVWEPSLPFDLATAGYAYTVLDDNHLRGAFVPEDAMWGTYTTDDQGRMLTIFGTEKGLRYRIPWKPVADLIDYLRDNATEEGDRVGIMGDDGEKFGAWPGTYELCWSREQWVERCFAALEENTDWLTTVTPAAWMAEHPAIGRVYVPTSSYVEMTEWALPANEQPVFHAETCPSCVSCAAAFGATSRRAIARSTICTSRCCVPRPPFTRCPRARNARGRSTTCFADSRTTATGTACSGASTSCTCAWPRRPSSSLPRISPSAPKAS